jgi:hypothetical protein
MTHEWKCRCRLSWRRNIQQECEKEETPFICVYLAGCMISLSLTGKSDVISIIMRGVGGVFFICFIFIYFFVLCFFTRDLSLCIVQTTL